MIFLGALLLDYEFTAQLLHLLNDNSEFSVIFYSMHLSHCTSEVTIRVSYLKPGFSGFGSAMKKWVISI